MENWRGLFRERFVIEENTEEKYLRKYDHRTIVEELEHFIEQELDKAREEGYEKGVKDGLKGKVFKKAHLTEEYRPFKNRGELEEFLKNTVTNWDEIFKVTEEAEGLV